MFINEPRLSDFKQVLLREGIQAEFVGGVLVCNNIVAVRRVSCPSVCPSPPAHHSTATVIHLVHSARFDSISQPQPWPASWERGNGPKGCVGWHVFQQKAVTVASNCRPLLYMYVYLLSNFNLIENQFLFIYKNALGKEGWCRNDMIHFIQSWQLADVTAKTRNLWQ